MSETPETPKHAAGVALFTPHVTLIFRQVPRTEAELMAHLEKRIKERKGNK